MSGVFPYMCCCHAPCESECQPFVDCPATCTVTIAGFGGPFPCSLLNGVYTMYQICFDGLLFGYFNALNPPFPPVGVSLRCNDGVWLCNFAVGIGTSTTYYKNPDGLNCPAMGAYALLIPSADCVVPLGTVVVSP